MPDMRTSAPHRAIARPALEIVIPVHNEQEVLEQSVRTLHAHCIRHLGCSFAITIADNASSDHTLALAHSLAAELTEVGVSHIQEKGRGRALRAGWGASRAEVVAYMDVDLSTDLSCLRDLVEPLLEERGDIAIGSRLTPGARVTRGLKRDTISRVYNLILRLSLQAGFSDAQCGFKAARREVIQALLPTIEDERWFFDTELLYRAQRAKLSIREIPVEWIEDTDSRVDVAATAREDLLGIMRLRREAREERRATQSAAPRWERQAQVGAMPGGAGHGA
jgi:glycosyltransferase involved in cell wall biosynthesis